MKRYTFILALVMSMLSFTNVKADKLLIRYGESSKYAYQTYSIQNAFDGKYDTKFWSNGNPEHTKSGETNYIELPYVITVSENHKPSDLIVVRAMIDKGDNGAYGQGVREGGCFDILLQVAEEEKLALSHTLTVTEDGWATLFLGFNAEIPEGVEAYIVKEEGINDTYISLTQVTGVIPANTGIIVKANAGEYELIVGETATADVTGNLLSGSAYNKNIEEEAYVLSNVDGEVGLYKAEMTDGIWLNNANKAYLPASAVHNKSAAFYGFDWNGTTGISEVKGENGNVKGIYDLTGRKVENSAAPGIYIIDGVKRVVR